MSYKIFTVLLLSANQPRRLRNLSLTQIKALPQQATTVTLQCAGNRRKEMSKVKEVKGLSWNCGSISTAEFKGRTIYDVMTFILKLSFL